jgi:hypothetical protein
MEAGLTDHVWEIKEVLEAVAGWRRAKLCVSVGNAVYCPCRARLPTLFRARPVTVYHLQRLLPHEAVWQSPATRRVRRPGQTQGFALRQPANNTIEHVSLIRAHLSMTLSDLETELKALEAHLLTLSTKLTVLSYTLIFCTAIVVVGLVVEYQPDLREWVTGRPRDRRKRWPTRVGALLVIVGVAGEVGLTFWSFKVESEIKSTNAKIERDLKAEIGILGTSAINAAASADRANIVAGTASQESEHARSVAGNAELSARVARQEADAYKSQIESVLTKALSTAKLVRWEGPRNIFVDEAHDTFNKHMRQFSGQAAISVVCGSQFFLRGDQEIVLTAGSLNVALKEAGWNVDNLHPATIDRDCPTIGEAVSVMVSQEAPKRTKDAAAKLLAVIDTVLSQGTVVIESPPKYFTITPLGSTGIWQPKLALPADTIEIAVRMHPIRPTGPTIDDNKLLGQ